METEIKLFIKLLNKKLNLYKKGLEYYETETENNEKYINFVFFIYNDNHKIEYYIENEFKLNELENLNINYTVKDYDYFYYNNGIEKDYYNEFIIEITETEIKNKLTELLINYNNCLNCNNLYNCDNSYNETNLINCTIEKLKEV